MEIARKEDFGVNDTTFIVNTHLGEILNFNDTVLGYDLEHCQVSDLDEAHLADDRLPPVVIVKKTYPKYRKNRRARMWKLKHFDDLKDVAKVQNDHDMSEEEEEESKQAIKKKVKKGKKVKETGDGKDYQLFLQDLEEDKELRSQVNMYRDDDVMAELEGRIAKLSLDD